MWCSYYVSTCVWHVFLINWWWWWWWTKQDQSSITVENTGSHRVTVHVSSITANIEIFTFTFTKTNSEIPWVHQAVQNRWMQQRAVGSRCRQSALQHDWVAGSSLTLHSCTSTWSPCRTSLLSISAVWTQHKLLHCYWSQYMHIDTGCWWVGCYIWYSIEGTGQGLSLSLPRPLLSVPNVAAHPSTTNVLTSYYSMWHIIAFGV